MICLCRYKVLLLKPHLRDMLASARRRRAIRCYSWVFLHDQMFDICKWCHSRILHMRLHGTIGTWFYWQRWDGQDVKEASPSQSRHRASRKGRDFGALWDWNDEVNEEIFGSSWTCLVSLSATSSRMFNQSPAHTLQSLDQTCFQTVLGRHGLRIFRWLAAFRWGRRWGGPARVGSFWFFLVDLRVMHLQAQPATSSRHVGFDKETWTSHADIHLKHMVHVVNCFDICQTCDRHVEDAQEASPSQKRHSASRKGSAVSLPLPFEDRFFCDTDVRRCGMCRLL